MEIAPYDEAVFPGLLNSYRKFEQSQGLLLEPKIPKLFNFLVGVCVIINYTCPVVPVLVANFSPKREIIPKGKLLAHEAPLKIIVKITYVEESS